jgi:TPP-dependent pyruvate/acetoin dehydrogenase alpha subunit
MEEHELLPSQRLRDLEGEVAAEIAAAVAFAEGGPLEPVADLLRDVYTPAGS